MSHSSDAPRFPSLSPVRTVLSVDRSDSSDHTAARFGNECLIDLIKIEPVTPQTTLILCTTVCNASVRNRFVIFGQ